MFLPSHSPLQPVAQYPRVDNAGRYAFTLDARDKDAPTLRVARLPQDGADAPGPSPAPGAAAH